MNGIAEDQIKDAVLRTMRALALRDVAACCERLSRHWPGAWAAFLLELQVALKSEAEALEKDDATKV